MADTMSLQRFVDDELAGVPTLVDQARVAAIGLLRRAPAVPDRFSTSDQPQRQEAARALSEHGVLFNAKFVEALRKLVLADLGPRERDKPSPAAGGPSKAAAAAGMDIDRSLALMDETVVESDIEISRAAAHIDGVVEWEQRELQTFTSALRGASHVGSDSNPIRPAMVARALWDASGALALGTPQRAHCQRAMAEAIAPLLKKTYAAACSRIEAKGVEPSRYRTVLLTAGGTGGSGGAGGSGRSGNPGDAGPGALQALSLNVAQSGTLLGLLTNMPVGAGSGRAVGAGALAKAGALGFDVEFALSRLDTMVRYASSAAANRDRGGAYYVGEQSLLARSAAPGIDHRLIELLSRLFDAILADPALPTAAKGAIARLQVSTLRVALRDLNLLESLEHPTWMLMDRIAAACQVAAAGGPERLYAIAHACDTLTDELARHAMPDAALYRQALNRLDAAVAQDMQRALQEVQGTIATLQRTDRRVRLKGQVQERLREQFIECPVGEATSGFLLGALAIRLGDSILEFGPDGDATVALTRLVDEMLWSLHPPANPASRRRLVKVLPALLSSLRNTMAECGLPEDEQKGVLDELEASHSATLWPAGGPAADGQEGPEDIVRRLREEAVDDLPRRHGLRDSVLDMASQDTVPIEMPRNHANRNAADPRSARRRDASSAVASLPTGSAVRLLLQGRWLGAQLLWRSDTGEILLLADSTGRTHAMTRSALERMQEEGLTNFDPPVSLIQRAVDSLLASSA